MSITGLMVHVQNTLSKSFPCSNIVYQKIRKQGIFSLLGGIWDLDNLGVFNDSVAYVNKEPQNVYPILMQILKT